MELGAFIIFIVLILAFFELFGKATFIFFFFGFFTLGGVIAPMRARIMWAGDWIITSLVRISPIGSK